MQSKAVSPGLRLRHIWQPLHGVTQIVRGKVRVMARDCGGLVSDNLSRNEVRETTRFEHRHRAVAQTVERNLAWLACS